MSVDLKNARYVSENILALPLYTDLSFEKIDEIIDDIRRILKMF